MSPGFLPFMGDFYTDIQKELICAVFYQSGTIRYIRSIFSNSLDKEQKNRAEVDPPPSYILCDLLCSMRSVMSSVILYASS